jgi:hypothetical protein
MDEHVVRQFIDELGKAFKPPHTPDYSPYIQQIANSLSGINGTLVAVMTALERLAFTAEAVGTATLETTAMKVLQEENGRLMATVSSLYISQKQILGCVKDLASPCIGCKKNKWTPHAPDCEWNSEIMSTLEGILDGSINKGSNTGGDETPL